MKVDKIVTAGRVCTPTRVTRLGESQAVLSIEDGAFAVRNGRIVEIGERSRITSKYEPAETLRFDDYLITPGLVDPHTHLLYMGNRSDELELKVQGLTYREIASRGGGIMRSVRDTRRGINELEATARKRLINFYKCGTTTLEVKTGYGLSYETEVSCVNILSSIANRGEMRIKKTLLSAHMVPDDYSDSDAYLHQVVFPTIDYCSEAKAVDFVDVFCEEGYFDVESTLAVCSYAKKAGFNIKLHADEFKDTGGARVAADLRAVSADHLGHSSRSNLKLMGEKGVVAVLLPLLYHSSMMDAPTIDKYKGVSLVVALGTDFNPNNPVDSQLTVMNHACLRMKMSPWESFCGVTINAAAAIGAEREVGALQPGFCADFAVYDSDGVQDLIMRCGASPLVCSYISGERVAGVS
ncbi:MAG: imidazolonepropionase [Candidatus Marsarchaeota archaeon]|nr:imidazolonepropionase [Candidatus Marsarchaeota archaeon]